MSTTTDAWAAKGTNSAIDRLWNDMEALAEGWEQKTAELRSEAAATDAHPNDRAWSAASTAAYTHAAARLRELMGSIIPARAARAA